MSQMLTKLRLLQITIGFVVLSAAFIHRTIQYKKSQQDSVSTVTIPCDITQAVCSLNVFGEQVSMGVEQAQIIPERDFKLSFTMKEGMRIIDAKIEGESMYMGWIPLQWQRVDNTSTYVAKSRVGACKTQNMVWAVQMTLANQQGIRQKVRFYFSVP